MVFIKNQQDGAENGEGGDFPVEVEFGEKSRHQGFGIRKTPHAKPLSCKVFKFFFASPPALYRRYKCATLRES